MAHHLATTVAIISATGGIMGYVKGNSVPSLVAGLVFGSAFGTASYLLSTNKDYGLELALSSSLLLSAAMIPKALKTRKPVPVTMGLLGLASLIYYSKKYMDYYA